MKKIIRIIAAATFVVVASMVLAGPNETLIVYYSDDTFQTYAGEEDYYCDNTNFSTGPNSAPWRTYDVIRCDNGHSVIHECQQNMGGTWTDIGCPPGI
jgi:hypothetical protein